MNDLLKRGMACALFAMACVAGAAYGADFPSKPLRLIVPFGPGGATDIVARTMAPKLGEKLGQPVVVENRPGAGGILATSAVAQSPADGYTLLMATIGFAANVGLHGSKLPFDPVKDFEPISIVAIVPTVLAVHPSVPARTGKELVDLAKAKPGTLNFGSAGSGTINHLAGELVKYLTNVDIVHVPYKSGGAVVGALVAGEISMVFATTPTSLAHFKSGRLFPIAVSGKNRIALLPDVPPLGETIPGFDAVEWQGIVAPAGTPKPVIDALHKAIVSTLTDPQVRERIIGLGAEPVGGTPGDFAAHVKVEVEKWRKVAQQTGMKAE